MAYLIYKEHDADECISDTHPFTYCVERSEGIPANEVTDDFFGCHNYAVCERQSSGLCGWTETEDFYKCVEHKTRKQKRSHAIREAGDTPYACESDSHCTVINRGYCGCEEDMAVNENYVELFSREDPHAYCEIVCGMAAIYMPKAICADSRCTGIVSSYVGDNVYEVFSKEKLDSIEESVALFFSDSSDTQSNSYHALLEEWSASGTLLFDVLQIEFEKNSDLARRYDAESRNTFVLLSDTWYQDRRILRTISFPTNRELSDFLLISE